MTKNKDDEVRKKQQSETAKAVKKDADPAVACEKEVAAKPEEINPFEKLKAEQAALNEKLLRNLAEFDNFKKRTAKEKQELVGYTKSVCFQEVLSVVDNFERALNAECKDEDFKKGMGMILTQLVEAMKTQGIEEIVAVGESFDPQIHNAINQVADENFGENIVCSVMQKGYKIGDKVIRHAMVVVANP